VIYAARFPRRIRTSDLGWLVPPLPKTTKTPADCRGFHFRNETCHRLTDRSGQRLWPEPKLAHSTGRVRCAESRLSIPSSNSESFPLRHLRVRKEPCRSHCSLKPASNLNSATRGMRGTLPQALGPPSIRVPQQQDCPNGGELRSSGKDQFCRGRYVKTRPSRANVQQRYFGIARLVIPPDNR
jgi:hypothetical protein